MTSSLATLSWCSALFVGHMELQNEQGFLTEPGRRVFLPSLGCPKNVEQSARKTPLTSLLTCAGYVEVHIEQGPVLERKGVALGVVPTICGQTRLTVTVQGAQARVRLFCL